MPDSEEITVLATATAKPGSEAAVAAALREAATPTLAQAGCLGFELLQSADNPAAITAIERWASNADHERHLAAPHLKVLMAKFDGNLASPPDIRVLRRL